MRAEVFLKISAWIATNCASSLSRWRLSAAIASARVLPATNSRRMHQCSRSLRTSSTFGTGRPVSAAPSRTMSLPVRSCRTSSPAAGAFLAGWETLGALVTLATLAAALSVEDFFMVV